MSRTLAIFLAFVPSTVLGAERTVWQIGKPDHDYAEFACAGDYRAYARQFGDKPVVFEVGRSDPARDWPFVQPGPSDSWSPAGGKPRAIRFTLPEQPRGVYRLRIDLLDVQPGSPARYLVAVGDASRLSRLAPGNGDVALTNPRAGKPQQVELLLPAARFHKGVNEIRLTSIEGSWIIYDAITLSCDAEADLAPEVRSITARPTPLLRREGKPRRAVDVSVTLAGPAVKLSLRAEAAGQSIQVSRPEQLFGFESATEEVAVPDVPEPLDVKLTATVGGRSQTTTVRVAPQRKWRVYVAPSSHTDIGW
jgi:alpha-mannosidase